MSNMVEVYRGSVQAWEADQMGHMNVQFYLEKAMSGVCILGARLGLSPEAIRSTGLRLAARDHHIRFLREQRPGAPVFMRAGIVDAHPDRLIVFAEMINTVSDTVAATFRTDIALVEARSGVHRPFDAQTLSKAGLFLTDIPDYGAPRGLHLSPAREIPALDEATGKNMLLTFMGDVLPGWCDGHGFMNERYFMGIVSDSIPNLLARTKGKDWRGENEKIGGAALEYRFIYHKRPTIGDILSLHSGLKAVSEKTYTWCHWLFDQESGRAVATAEAVAITLDLEARKAIAIPQTMRTHLEQLVIDGLGV